VRRLEIDRETLRVLIEVQDLSQRETGRILNCRVDTIRRRCREWGIQTARSGPKPGPRHPNWKGGNRVKKGYRYIWKPDHPHSTKQGLVAEHRLIVESQIGRFLKPTEVVHHVNADPLDNRPENLEIFDSNADHLRAELRGRVPNWTDDGRRKCQEALERGRRTLAKMLADRKAASGDLPRTL